ncbi:MAG: potassium-transporting ATPase subunit C [Lachnospiraceae bacterium]
MKLNNLWKSILFLLIMTILCGGIYTGIVTAVAGSILSSNKTQVGCELLGQPYTQMTHMWGRIMNPDVTTYKDENGEALLYASPSNLSPASKVYEALVADRIKRIKAAHPSKKNTPIPVDLVTCSGSGLDPHISPKAAEYQVERLANANGIPIKDVRAIIQACTQERFLGIFGEKTVNVLQVNLMLDNRIQP